MRVVVQKVSEASVSIDGKITGAIKKGLLVFVSFTHSDDEKKIVWMSNKLVNLRVFPDSDGKMNISVKDINGGILLVSNFTLYGDLKKGYRPNYMRSAPPDISEPLYDKMLNYMKENYDLQIESGVFGAMMDVQLTNDGPVTVMIDKD